MEHEAFEAFIDRQLITDVLYEAKSGKEATVYCCRAHPSTGHEYLAAKIYRTQNHRSFANDAAYRDGEYIASRRAKLALKKKTDFGRDVQYGTWIAREWETFGKLHAAGATVPEPVAQGPGAILMEYFGDAEAPAPMLHEVELSPEEAQRHLRTILRNIRLWLDLHVVHGDLSAYNILHWRGRIAAIDFPQACDPRLNRNAFDFLRRDVANVCRHFARYGAEENADLFTAELWRDFTLGRVG